MFEIFCVITLFLILRLDFSKSQLINNVMYSHKGKGAVEQKLIALTFDDGPHGNLTPKLLDVLKEKHANVTFFVMGVKVVMHPSIVARANAEGHEIANHVWDHPVLSKIPREQVHDQITRTNEAIKKALGFFPSVMRPPYGNTNPRLNKFITKDTNLPVIMWSLDTNDWKRPSPDKIVNFLMERVKPGDIILCHDIHPGTIEAMPQIIDGLRGKGFVFTTVSKLLEIGDGNQTQSEPLSSIPPKLRLRS